MATARELGIAFVDLDRIVIDQEALAAIPPAIAIEHQVVPIKAVGDTLFVAGSSPNSTRAFDSVASVTGKRIIPVLATEAALREVIRKSYGKA